MEVGREKHLKIRNFNFRALHVEGEVLVFEQIQSLDMRVLSFSSQLMSSLKNYCDVYLLVRRTSYCVCCKDTVSV